MLPIYSISSLLTTLFNSTQDQGQCWGGFWLSSWVANPVTLLRGLGLYIRKIIAHPFVASEGNVLALGSQIRDTPGFSSAEKTLGHLVLPFEKGTWTGSMIHSLRHIHISSLVIFSPTLWVRFLNSFSCPWLYMSVDLFTPLIPRCLALQFAAS